MKTLLKNSLTFLLMLMPVLAFAQQAPQRSEERRVGKEC